MNIPLRHRLIAFLALLLVVFSSQPAVAAMIGDADISYHAIRTVVFKGKRYTGPVWSVPGKQRHEQQINGLNIVVILRADTNMAVVMLPDVNIYTTFPMSEELDKSSLKRPVARDTVAGVPAAKFRLRHREPDGTGADGWLWIGAHNVLLKLDGTYHTAGGNDVPVTASLSKIETGPQDPALFEVPSSMASLPVEAIAPLLGFKPD